MPLDFFGYANHSKPSSMTALSTADATASTSALHRTKAITQSTFLSEVFDSLIPSVKCESSEAKSGGASLSSTVIRGLIPNFLASPDELMICSALAPFEENLASLGHLVDSTN
jgi:hypothetical protein